MGSGFQFDGKELDAHFDPYVAGAKAPAVPFFTPAGQNLSDRYAPISVGLQAGITRFKIANGDDLNTLYAAFGTATYLGTPSWNGTGVSANRDTAYVAPPVNVAPVARFNYSVSGLTITITDTSYDTNGNYSYYNLNWGDGTVLSNQPPLSTRARTYAASGAKSVTLTAFDTNGLSSAVNASLTAGGGGTGGGGGGGCVWAYAYMSTGKQAKDYEVGHPVYGMTDKGEFIPAFVESLEVLLEPCIRVRTSGSYCLTFSSSTPITLKTGNQVMAADLTVGTLMAVRDEATGQDYWDSITRVEDMGIQPVIKFNVGGMSFAAGDNDGMLIYTHNTTDKS